MSIPILHAPDNTGAAFGPPLQPQPPLVENKSDAPHDFGRYPPERIMKRPFSLVRNHPVSCIPIQKRKPHNETPNTSPKISPLPRRASPSYTSDTRDLCPPTLYVVVLQKAITSLNIPKIQILTFQRIKTSNPPSPFHQAGLVQRRVSLPASPWRSLRA